LTGRSIDKKEISLRSLRIEDYDKMITCWNKSGLPIKITGRDSKESIANQMQLSGSSFIGAFKGPRLVGLVLATYDGRRGWINRIAILPKYRRQGLAAKLIDKAEGFLKDEGAKVIAALIDRSNSASRALFERKGYSNNEDILYYSKRESADA